MPQPLAHDPILIIEDDRTIAGLIKTYLSRAGFETIVVHDGAKALEVARRCNPLLVVLDLMLPGVDGWQICQEIRRASDVPILMLTARAEESDRILGFSFGADDYVVKPFSPRELVERVKAILRRAGKAQERTAAPIVHGPLALYPDKRKVTVGGTPVSLTRSEFTLLHALMSARGRVFSRDELLARLYRSGETVIDRVIDVHIGKLRQKIEVTPSKPQLILTVHGVGYRFADVDDG